MDSTQTPPRLLFRKNGRPQACEPCRKRKVACDHAQPVCNRCRKSKRPGEVCEYILSDSPAASRETSRQTRPREQRRASRAPSTPLTSTFQPTATSLSQLGPGPAVVSQTASTATATTSPATSTTRHRPSLPASLPTSPDSASTAATPAVTPAVLGIGYLGFTSFCGIYEETRSSLKQLQPSTAAPIGEIGTTAYCGLECSPPLTAQALETCLTILRHVPDRETGLKLFDSHLNPSDGWIRLAAKHMMISLYDTFPQYFSANEHERRPDDAQLTALARTICGNTAKCVSDEESDPAKWMAQFTGTNLRWESLGVMFAYWELAARYLGPYRPDVGSRFQCVDEGTKVVMQYRYCLGACIELTKAAGSGGNTLLLFMCSKRTIIESLFSGDASFACWQLHAETVALSTFLGFHDEVAAAPGVGYKPTVCSEIKRKLFCYIFYVDKVLASFAGRPPLISRRYARTPPPLDLKDDHLLSDEATLARHVAALDENGWNTEGGLYSATIVRSRVMLAHIRDEIFEIALGQGSVTLVETLLEIKERQLRTVAGFPDIMTFKEEDIQNRKLDISLLYTRLIIKLEHLQNMFFIQRLLSKRGHDDGALLSVSFEMVSKTLMFWTNMDRLSCMNGDFEWLVMAYAAPGGGILCLELLKPTLHGGHHPQNPQVSRSSIIQKLSLLVGFLDWVSPTAPNGDLCADCKVIIQRVLDQALNGPAASASSAVDGGLPGVLDIPMDWDFSTQLDFNFDLLDTFDWLRPEVSLSQQSS
ncbi:fungal-specific transcription factor domain-containing protein [Colletotrichum phormii]|uniref:Fungal-specific transcription factor domain-containing protein n=1 Tax=Colletotrichum phormii TaxID=359342 RepID=A0AAJ0A3X2_9PEZI|nr:fungal-specific transcription factor domain-containing protein [Colletotrichum phormii]KAK1656023.1 fungal-specific transcription factor domain-containing protein [Colletotrichum phormii]